MADRAFRTFVESRWYRRCRDPQSRSKDHPCRRDMLGLGAVLAGVSFGEHVHSQDTYWLLVADIVLYLNVRMWEEVDDEMLSTDDLSRESNGCSSVLHMPHSFVPDAAPPLRSDLPRPLASSPSLHTWPPSSSNLSKKEPTCFYRPT